MRGQERVRGRKRVRCRNEDPGNAIIRGIGGLKFGPREKEDPGKSQGVGFSCLWKTLSCFPLGGGGLENDGNCLFYNKDQNNIRGS